MTGMPPRPDETASIRSLSAEEMFNELSHRIGPIPGENDEADAVAVLARTGGHGYAGLHGHPAVMVPLLVQALAQYVTPKQLMICLLETMRQTGDAQELTPGRLKELMGSPPPEPSQS